MQLEKNVGTVDRIVRVGVGVALAWYGFESQSWWGLVGIVIAFTGVLGTCWVYSLLGMSTCRVKMPPTSTE